MKKLLTISFLFIVIAGFNHNLIAQANNYLGNMVLVEGVYKRNLGNFGNVWANAAGGTVSYGFFLPDHNLLIVRTGYISHNLKDGVGNENASFGVLPLHIGGRYYFINNRFMPFVSFMNGLNIIFQNFNYGVENNIKTNETLVKYAFQVGLGITINLVSNLNLDLSANYNSHFYLHEEMMTAIEYTFGLGWKFQSN